MIYLASGSKARRELLKVFGFRFKVFPCMVKEDKAPGSGSYAALVKRNALAKATAAAERINRGIVIAADTITVQGRKIAGKPRSIAAARSMLKRLSQKPQWMYTGVAVIKKTKAASKILVDYEKTKVYMDRMKDEEIDAYFRKVSPLDKAGSFDIQGKGSFFIRRIEGCFYNVVGLPMRKLYRMLKEMGVVIFVVIFCIIFSGCSTEYNIVTGEQERYVYSTDSEVKMGQAIAKEVEKEYKFAEDPLLQKRVEDIGEKISAVCDRKDIDYHFYVLEDDEVNAISLPGGYVYINKGLLEKVSNDDELAGVIGHEVGHIVARHSIKKLQALQGYSILRILVATAPGAGDAGAAADEAFLQLLLGYSREDELLADQLGARYSRLAGYNPRGMIDFLTKLQEINRHKPLAPKSYYKTHPYVPDRIRVVKQELGEGMSFKDFINIEQNTHK